MEIEHIKDEENEVDVVKVVGKLDVFSFGELKSYFDQLFDANKEAKVVCNVSDVSYIASSGWSVLLARRKMARRDGGNLILMGMTEEIGRVYESMKIGKLLPHADNVAEAAELMQPEE